MGEFGIGLALVILRKHLALSRIVETLSATQEWRSDASQRYNDDEEEVLIITKKTPGEQVPYMWSLSSR